MTWNALGILFGSFSKIWWFSVLRVVCAQPMIVHNPLWGISYNYHKWFNIWFDMTNELRTQHAWLLLIINTTIEPLPSNSVAPINWKWTASITSRVFWGHYFSQYLASLLSTQHHEIVCTTIGSDFGFHRWFGKSFK